MHSADLERWLTTQLPRWENARIESLVEVAGGWESDVYDVRVRRGTGGRDTEIERMALRRYTGVGEVAKREFDGMRSLFEIGYPVPEILGVETSAGVLGRPFMVMRWVEGEIRSWRDADLDALAQLLADLHRLDWHLLRAGPPEPPGAFELIDRWREQLAGFQIDSLAECLDWAAQSAASIRSQPAIVHLDFHTGNVLIGADGSATVIDWTQVGVADRRLDVAWTEMLLSMALDQAAAARLRTAYERAAGPLEHMEWFEMASAAKRLFSVLVSLRAGPEVMGMRPEARERMMSDIHTLEVPWRRVKEISGIDVVEARRLFEA